MNHPGLDRSPMVSAAMQREQLRSERQRVSVLIGVMAFLWLVLVTLWRIPSFIREDLRPQLLEAFGPLVAVTVAALVYEIGVFLWLGRLQGADRSPPPAFRYVNALVEISFPTAAIAAGAVVLGGFTMLAGATPFVYFLFLGLTALNLDYRLCVFAGAVAGLELVTMSSVLFAMSDASATSKASVLAMLHSPHQYLSRGAFLLTGGAIAGLVSVQIRRQISVALRTLEERDRAISIFGQHVSPQVAELLLKQSVDFAGEERNVCVMFLDIRDFSRIAGDRSPAEVVDYLNALFGPMIPLVSEHRGIINKFLGDGFMAVFGAPVDDPESCCHAVAAAHALLDVAERLSREKRIPPTRLGIGLHLGLAITGNVGGEERKEYTVIGDVVNLSSRVEQATKMFGARLLVTEAVLDALGERRPAEAQDLGPVELKGQTRAVRLFKLA